MSKLNAGCIPTSDCELTAFVWGKLRNDFKIVYVRHLGSGTYNHVYEVHSGSNKRLALRVSGYPSNMKDLKEEIELYKDMNKHGVGAKALKTALYEVPKSMTSSNDKQGIAAILMEVADGNLAGFLGGDRKDTGAIEQAVDTLYVNIKKAAKAGYVCADIKPENVLMFDGKAKLADFDPKLCPKNKFRTALCKRMGIKPCKLDPGSHGAVHALYVRVMMYQMLAITKMYGQGVNKDMFLSMFHERMEKEKGGMKRIVIGKRHVEIKDILYDLTGNADFGYLDRILGYYLGTATPERSEEFEEAFKNFLSAPARVSMCRAHTLKTLRTLAKQRKVKGYSSLKKADLCKLLGIV